MIADRERFDRAIAAFDHANRDDPKQAEFAGQRLPAEVAYALAMTAWLDRLEPDAPEAVRLAARSQHIRRWTIPRDRYPMDRAGYHRWRSTLARFHAETAGEILRQAGYDPSMIARVAGLLRKENLRADPDMQLLEDVICLVFLEREFPAFAARHDEAKVIGILKKTWAKMTPRGQAAALALPMAQKDRALIERALAT